MGNNVARSKTKAKPLDIVAPTDAQLARDEYTLEKTPGETWMRNAVHYRKERQLEAIHKRGLITQNQYRALAHYRHHADIVDRSLTRDSLTMGMPSGGGSDGLPFEGVNAQQVLAPINASLGALADMAQKVLVLDMSLDEYAMAQHGSHESAYCSIRGVGVAECRETGGDVKTRIRAKAWAVDEAALGIAAIAGIVERLE